VRSQTGAKRSLDKWRVRAYCHHLAEIHSQFMLEVYQLAYLPLVTRAEEPSVK
jgi:hypothetical protein